MAGGEGTRLRPLTCDCPKPMLRLMGKPLMEYAIRLLQKHGVTQIGATLAYLPDAITDYFGDGEDFGVRLHYYIEKIPLGTAGSVRQASEFLSERFIVLSGDGITDFDLRAALDFHIRHDASATLILKKCGNPQEYGMVVTDAEGCIKSFHEKPGRSDVFSDKINTGIYILEPELLKYIPADRPFDFGHDLFPMLLADGVALYGYAADGYWCDVGDVPAYLRVHMDALEGRIRLDGLPHSGISAEGAILEPGCRLDPPCHIGRGSRIAAGAHIGPYTVIGENCLVEPMAGLKRSILLDGARVESGAQLRGCIAGRQAQIGDGAQLYEDSVVGSRSRIGVRATLPPGVKLWPDKALPDGERPEANIVWGACREQRFIGGGLQLESPAQAARSVQACIAELKPRELLLGRGASTVSDALWHAAAAGAMAQGVQLIDAGHCTLPQLRHCQRSLRADCAMLVEDSALIPLQPNGALLPERTQRAILKLCERQDFSGPFSNLTHPMEAAGRTDIGYIARAASAFCPRPDLAPEILLHAPAPQVLELAEQAFRRAGLSVRSACDADSLQPESSETGVYLSADGQQVVLADGSERLSEAQRQLLLAWTALQLGETRLILHTSCTRAIDTLAQQAGAQTLYLSGEYARWMSTLADQSPLQFDLQFDGICAALYALSCLSEAGFSLSQWRAQVPSVYQQRTSVQVPPSESGRLLHTIAHQAPQAELGGGVRLTEDRGWAWLSPDDHRPELHITTEAMSMEAAQGMCDFYADAIRKLMAVR